jgi:hypothetical protein
MCGATSSSCSTACRFPSRQLQCLAAAHWQAMLAIASAAGSSFSRDTVFFRMDAVMLPSKCPSLVNTAFLAYIRQMIASSATVRTRLGVAWGKLALFTLARQHSLFKLQWYRAVTLNQPSMPRA